MPLGPGDQIGSVVIDREIGRGGMGVVFVGRDTVLGRLVAVKTLSEGVASGGLLTRIEQEARTLAQLNHPSIGAIYGVEMHDGAPCLLLEHVAGETLAERLERGAVSVGGAVGIGVAIASGLEAAHGAGVVHRDLKPANIKVLPDGGVKILDFGLAGGVGAVGGVSAGGSEVTTMVGGFGAGLSGETAPGTVLGTPAYMSPEQARGLRVDARADAWSFGVLMYEMLTGTNPFARETAADSLSAVLHGEVDFSLVSHVPQMLRHVLVRCLERDVGRRWGSMGSVRIELEDIDGGGSAAVGLVREGPETGRFVLDEAVCRRMDREGLDPRVLGWGMQYADNRVESDAVVVWVPSFGGDHTISYVRRLMEGCPCRMVVPTPIGLEPGSSVRPVLSDENQEIALLAFVEDVRARLGPRHVVLSGGSCGGVVALRCAGRAEASGLIDGLLLIDPDVQESDCFVTGLFAALEDGAQHSAVEAARRVSMSCGTLEEWLAMHTYLTDCIEKVKDDISPLIRQARRYTEPFRGVRDGASSPFVGWLRAACDRVGRVRCVLPDHEEKHRVVGEMRLAHLDGRVLGESFCEETIGFHKARTHIGVLLVDRVNECIEEFVAGF